MVFALEDSWKNGMAKKKYSFKSIIFEKGSPKKIAISFAVGVFLGFSPLYGIQILMSLLVSFIFRLNKIVTIAGSLVTNPWTVIPVYTANAFIGMFLLGRSFHSLPNLSMSDLTDLSELLSKLGSLMLPITIGGLLLGIIGAVAGYFIVYFIMMKRKRTLAENKK